MTLHHYFYLFNQKSLKVILKTMDGGKRCIREAAFKIYVLDVKFVFISVRWCQMCSNVCQFLHNKTLWENKNIWTEKKCIILYSTPNAFNTVTTSVISHMHTQCQVSQYTTGLYLTESKSSFPERSYLQSWSALLTSVAMKLIPFLFLFNMIGTKTGSSFASQCLISLGVTSVHGLTLYTSQWLCNTISLLTKPVKVQMCEGSQFKSISRIKQI